jgi:hypothetical protein
MSVIVISLLVFLVVVIVTFITFSSSSAVFMTTSLETNIGTNNPQLDSVLNSPYQVKVKFDSITVRSTHDPGFISPQSDGEYDLVVYVQGQKVDLTAASGPGSGLWDISMGEMAKFDSNAEITVEIPGSLPLSIFTVGHEIDECNRIPTPKDIEKLDGILKDTQRDRLLEIGNIQKSLNSYDCDSTLENDNEVLGLINKLYYPPGQSYEPIGYGAGAHTNVISSTRDFILRYTISVTAPPDPLVSEGPVFRIISTNPTNGDTDVNVASPISVTYSLPIVNCNMEPYFWVGPGDVGRTFGIQGSKSLSSDGITFTFDPLSSLEPSKLYDASVRAQVIDSSGRCQNLEYRWSFTTSGAQQPPVNSCGNNLDINSVTASGNDGNIPSNVLDGNINTRWSNNAIGSYIIADLGSTKDLCSVDISWFDGNNRMYIFAIATSIDGNTFTTKLAQASSGTTINSEKYFFSATDSRYIRVTIYGNTVNTWAAMTELDVFG